QELEAALVLEPSRRDVRAVFGDALLERAQVAEVAGRLLERDELVQRLALFDEDGERMRVWSAPAALGLSSKPADAAVEISRFVADARGHRRLETVRSLPDGPKAVELEPGSYLIGFRARGRAPVLAAVRLDRGERYSLAVDLPA